MEEITFIQRGTDYADTRFLGLPGSFVSEHESFKTLTPVLLQYQDNSTVAEKHTTPLLP